MGARDERRSRRQNTAVELLQFHGGRFLLQSKRALERQFDQNAAKTFVLHDDTVIRIKRDLSMERP